MERPAKPYRNLLPLFVVSLVLLSAGGCFCVHEHSFPAAAGCEDPQQCLSTHQGCWNCQHHCGLGLELGVRLIDIPLPLPVPYLGLRKYSPCLGAPIPVYEIEAKEAEAPQPLMPVPTSNKSTPKPKTESNLKNLSYPELDPILPSSG